MRELLLIFALAVGLQAQSIKDGKELTRWKPLIESQIEGITFKAYFAPETIRRGETYTKVWMRADFPNGGGFLFPNWHGPEIGSFRGSLTLGCTNKTLGGGSIILYGMKDNILLEKNIKEALMESPESLGQILLDTFCEREAAPLKVPPKLRP